MSYTLTPSTLKSEVGVSPPTCRLPPVTTSKANTSPGHGEEQCDGLRSCGLPWHTETIPFRFHFLSLISVICWSWHSTIPWCRELSLRRLCSFVGAVTVSSHCTCKCVVELRWFLFSWKTRLWCYKKAVLLEPATTMTFDPFIAFGFVGFIVWMLVIRIRRPLSSSVTVLDGKGPIYRSLRCVYFRE